MAVRRKKVARRNAAASAGRKSIISALVRFAVLLLLIPLALLAGSGRLDWLQAWAYFGVTLLAIIGGRLIVARRNPDLLLERAQSLSGEGVKRWDRVLAPLVAMWGPTLLLLVAALDKRFGLSPLVPLWVNLLGLADLAAGSAFSTWAMVVNKFFSAHVRIQANRGHSVISDGPYRVVRHPGYAGGLLLTLFTPLLLGSYWAYLPAVMVAAAHIIRTWLEDRTLQAELPGYREYAARTRFRLIPGMW